MNLKTAKLLGTILNLTFVSLVILVFTVFLRPSTNQYVPNNTFAQDMIVYFQSNVIYIISFLGTFISIFLTYKCELKDCQVTFPLLFLSVILLLLAYLSKINIPRTNLTEKYDSMGQVITLNQRSYEYLNTNKFTEYRYKAFFVLRAASFGCAATALVLPFLKYSIL